MRHEPCKLHARFCLDTQVVGPFRMLAVQLCAAGSSTQRYANTIEIMTVLALNTMLMMPTTTIDNHHDTLHRSQYPDLFAPYFVCVVPLDLFFFAAQYSVDLSND